MIKCLSYGRIAYNVFYRVDVISTQLYSEYVVGIQNVVVGGSYRKIRFPQRPIVGRVMRLTANPKTIKNRNSKSNRPVRAQCVSKRAHINEPNKPNLFNANTSSTRDNILFCSTDRTLFSHQTDPGPVGGR